MPNQTPSIGRVVHFVLPDGHHKGEHRPAMIVRVWGDSPNAAVNLVVFVDGENDYIGRKDCTLWATSKLRDDDGAPGTWHWPEYVP